MSSFFASFFATLAMLSGGLRDVAATIIPYMRDYEPPPAAAYASVLFGGDLMFDRSVRTVMERRGDDVVFSCIAPLLQMHDLVVANLEGPITTHVSVSATTTPGHPDNMTFTFAPSTADLLYRHNIRAVNLGNNHITNFGAAGVHSTIAMLQSSGVDYFGVPSEALPRPTEASREGGAKEGDPTDHRVASTEIHGVPLALISYNEFLPSTPSTSSGLAGSGQAASTTIAQIRAARAAGFIPVVYTHWGIEYATTSPQYLRDLAYSFVDEGAEIVIGSHPHVVADHELYQGKHIYYSLGNFVFDQYWDAEVSRGLLLQVTFSPAGVAGVHEIPIELKRDRTTCMALTA
ncbi:CapA family protein [Candidatus Kaiserbacteria bacterium]|nr:CapA family protein [Candidatus Kaiserbacteria bacterium]